MIQVCDAIMGTGKSSAAITYMNEHHRKKFIYITPFLEEAKRIKNSCPGMHFAEPSDKIEKYHFKKCEHTAALISQGRNIATTHQSFKMYSDEMLEDIQRHGYQLIIDENVDVLERYDCHLDDIKIAVKAGYVKEENGTYTLADNDYNGFAFRELFKFLKSRELVQATGEDESGSLEHLFYWILPPELITSFEKVIILTYMFRGQSLHHFLEIYNLKYEYIGVQKNEDGTFRFCQTAGYTPDYVRHIEDMIHILDNDKLNSIGDNFHALSMNWYGKHEDKIDRLQKNIYNCVNNVWRSAPSKEKLWGCFNKYKHKLQGKGYSKSFLTFNSKATNAYRDKKYLIYAVNLFMNVSDKNFYRERGIDIDEDAYALSIMVQWIWRSAIRGGEEIYLYIPSKRMRTLLIKWIDSLKGGENVVETN